MDKTRHPVVFRSWKVERLRQNKQQAKKVLTQGARPSRKTKP